LHLSHLIDTIKTKDTGKPPLALGVENTRYRCEKQHFVAAIYKIYHIVWFAGEYPRIQGRERPL
jgi:hypothetical protein